MEAVGYRNEEYEASIEKLMKAVCGDLDPEETADLKARRIERFKARRERAVKSAQKMLRQVNRPVGRRDMLSAMDTAVMNRVSAYEQQTDMRNASLLLATVICKNLLTDGPLHGEE